ncbi:MAG: SDR family oxidoreductase [Ectothiorhodospiraceae bacterium]|nr:SDR family oxidoreductase [Chromatiales bacterium]MCP5153802.1 SDR family oxidoreductase [Ectothiorhodospiraceae bacterium]
MLDLQLEGKVAIVTGGSDGLGRATAHRLAASGARVAICARRADHLEAAAEAVRRATGGEVLAVPTDVADARQIDAFVEAVSARFGGLDILVNNAGTSAANPFESLDDAAWIADIDLKLMSAVRMCRHAIPLMRARGGGSILNVTIVGGKAPAARSVPTSVTRAAGINLTKALANEFAPEGIRVNTICLGLVQSAQWERRAAAQGKSLAELTEEMAKRIPLGRMGTAEEFADLAAFLVSPLAGFITGTAINFDGGASAVV